MITGEQFAAEARRWIGTPYRHQASTFGAGTDCLGLIRGVWRTLVGAEPEIIAAYTADWMEPTGEEAVLKAAERWLHPKLLKSNGVGDVIVFRMRDGCVAKHLGITAEKHGSPTFIHSYTDHGVVESYLSAPWLRRVVGRFAFPQGVQ